MKMKYFPMLIKPPIVQSAIAGMANRIFCQKLLNLGVGMITLGGYSIDNNLIEASEKMVIRGRKEFLFPKEFNLLKTWFKGNLSLEKKRKEQLIAINLRVSQIDEMSTFWLKNLHRYVDVIELNAHCRQNEIIEMHGGEYLLDNFDFLSELLQKIRNLEIQLPLGIKVRGHKIKNKRKLVNLLLDFNLSYIHVDAMIPGKNQANSDIIAEFTKISSIPIIANNSIRTIENVKDMIKLGATAVSMARPLIEKPLAARKLIESLEGLENEDRDLNTL